MTPSDDELDRAILVQARPRRYKVAWIIVKAMDEFDGKALELTYDLPDGVGYSDPLLIRMIARVKTLVAAGKLEGFGDLSRPRWSEVKLPEAKT